MSFQLESHPLPLTFQPSSSWHLTRRASCVVSCSLLTAPLFDALLAPPLGGRGVYGRRRRGRQPPGCPVETEERTHDRPQPMKTMGGGGGSTSGNGGAGLICFNNFVGWAERWALGVAYARVGPVEVDRRTWREGRWFVTDPSLPLLCSRVGRWKRNYGDPKSSFYLPLCFPPPPVRM